MGSVFRDLSTQVEACFDATSIADICARATQHGVRKTPHEGYVYVI